LRWDGLCDVYADEEYGQDIPFRVETPVAFTGVRVVAADGEEAVAALAVRFDPGEFTGHEPRPLGSSGLIEIWYEPAL
jgi:hypothetical protein